MILLVVMHFSLAKAYAGNGSKIAVLGDSMTWIGGDSCENPTGWTHTLRQSRLFDDIDIFARSGATWTNTTSTIADTSFYSEVLHDNNVIYNQVLRLIEKYDEEGVSDPDCIMIFAGANDAWFSDRRPGIFNCVDTVMTVTDPMIISPDMVTSLCGSVKLVCDILRHRFPESSQILVTPLQMSKVSADITLKVSDIIDRAGRSRGCVVLRADQETAVRHDDEVNHYKYTYDGVHTNPQGAAHLGCYILNNIKRLKILKTE